jgi:hypothetical protein
MVPFKTKLKPVLNKKTLFFATAIFREHFFLNYLLFSEIFFFLLKFFFVVNHFALRLVSRGTLNWPFFDVKIRQNGFFLRNLHKKLGKKFYEKNLF